MVREQISSSRCLLSSWCWGLQLSRASLGSLGGGVVDSQYVSKSKDALKRELCLAVDGAFERVARTH